MAACGSLEHIFKKPLQDNNNLTLLENPCLVHSSFTGNFGELRSPPLPASSSFPPPSCSVDLTNQPGTAQLSRDETKATLTSTLRNQYPDHQRKCSIFSLRNSDSLQMCTEGLGSESSDDVGDLMNEIEEEWRHQEEKVSFRRYSIQGNLNGEFRRLMSREREFPPPISCIGESGKPGSFLKSYRQNGRFVLKQVTIRSQELFHACREDGRLKLQFIQPDDETIYEAEDEYENEEDNLMEEIVQETTFDGV